MSDHDLGQKEISIQIQQNLANMSENFLCGPCYHFLSSRWILGYDGKIKRHKMNECLWVLTESIFLIQLFHHLHQVFLVVAEWVWHQPPAVTVWQYLKTHSSNHVQHSSGITIQSQPTCVGDTRRTPCSGSCNQALSKMTSTSSISFFLPSSPRRATNRRNATF